MSATPQHLPRQRAGVLAAFHQYFAVDNGGVDAAGVLDVAGAAAGQVVDQLRVLVGNGGGVEDRGIRPQAGPQQAAVANAQD
ncbi:MAG: hypothetical protein HY320_07960 [Armatimonadetes bacterium]|nr:hypothetical protein [Armatimonadota bacterium]